MSIRKRHKLILVGAVLLCVGFSSFASSRPWKPTPTQVAGDYAVTSGLNFTQNHRFEFATGVAAGAVE